MSDDDWDGMLAEAAGEVLETMFFTDVQGPADADEFDPALCRMARVSFAGTPGGVLTIAVSEPAVRVLAVNFLAPEESDDLPEPQLGGVACELANMICGSLLSRVETEMHFRLSSPELSAFSSAAPVTPPCRSLNLGVGSIHMWLDLESHAA